MKEYRVFTMYSEELQKEKRIFVYLPSNYEKTEKFYSVLYMNDGQNLFDSKIAYNGKSWNVIDAFNNDPTLPEIIVVGIENGGDSRDDELLPFEITNDDGTKAGGLADEYLTFITSKVKPLIDHKYRTFKSPKNTAFMGSSFGGVNVTYAACAYSTFFTRYAALSNAYFYPGIFRELQTLVKNSSLNTVKKFYIDCGTNEDNDPKIKESYLESNKEMYEILKEKIPENILKYKVIENATHSEKDWEDRFPEIVKFLFND